MARCTDAEIERAIYTVASLIDRFGEAYWPILEMLEGELAARRDRSARLAAYLERASDPLKIDRKAVSAFRSSLAPASGVEKVKGRVSGRAAAPPLRRSEADDTDPP